MIEILVDGIPRIKGGIGTFLLNMARRSKLSKDEPRINFSFIIPKNSEYKEALEKNGCKTYDVPDLRRYCLYKKALSKIFSEKKFDYIWINNTSKVNKLLLILANRYSTKIITHPHGVDNEETGIKKLIFKYLDEHNQQFFFESIDIPLACSVKAAATYYNDSEKLTKETIVIHNGIFTEDFVFSEQARKEIRNKYNISNNEILIGTVGRLSAVKNHMFLIRVLNKLNANYKLIILGEGEDRKKIEMAIKENDLDLRTVLPGQIDNVNDCLCAFDLFVLPSFHEGMPLSVIEAQATGLQCIISDTVSKEVAITDLVYFARLNDVNEWCEKIMQCTTSMINIPRNQYAKIIAESGYSIENSYSCFQKAVSHDNHQQC